MSLFNLFEQLLTIVEENPPSKPYVCYILAGAPEIGVNFVEYGVLFIYVIDPITGKAINSIKIINLEEVLKVFPHPYNMVVNTFILNVFDFQHPDYPHNALFCQMLAEKLDGEKFYFVSNDTVNFTATLMDNKIISKLNETVLVVLFQDNGFGVIELTRKLDGYEITDRRLVECCENDYYDPIKARKEVIGNSNPKHIIISATTTLNPKHNKLLKEIKTKILKNDKFIEYLNFKCPTYKIVNELQKVINDQNNIAGQYRIVPHSGRIYVGLQDVVEDVLFQREDALLTVKSFQRLPAEVSCYAPRYAKQFYLGTINEKLNICNIFDPEKLPETQCHRYKVFLNVDIQNQSKLHVEPKMIPEIQSMPSKLTEKFNCSKDKKIPIIGLFDNSSVICIWYKNLNSYKFCEQWNGIWGKDLFLSFEGEKPMLVEYRNIQNPASVVYG